MKKANNDNYINPENLSNREPTFKMTSGSVLHGKPAYRE
jgi:hypothetical protein